uniref:PDZ domain-containing protein n=1 Tax=Trichuris muris TaxID=70415 RepID=A0A5S6QHG2_TRIMR
MKVTVYFGPVRIVVPVQNDGMLVKDLIGDSIRRYKKVCGKADDSWVYVHNLKSCDDGGIFDPDDKVVCVADDREQILAVFEEDEEATSVQPSVLDEPSGVRSDGGPWSIRTQDEHLFNACATLRESERCRRELCWVGQRTSTHRPFGDGSSSRNSSDRLAAQADRRTTSSHNVQCTATNSVDAERDVASNACPRSATVAAASPCPVDVNGATSSDSSSTTARVKQFEAEPEESSRFVRSAARKSRITDEWLDIAAKASEDWWKSQEVSEVGRGESPNGEKGKKVVQLSMCPLDNLNVEDFVIRPKYGSSGKLESLLIEAAKQSSATASQPCANMLLAGDEIVEIHNCYVSSFNFEEAYRFLKTMSNDQVLKLKVLRGSRCADYQANTAGKPRSTNGFATGASSPLAEPKSALRSALQKGNTRKMGVTLDVRLCKEKEGLGFTVTSRDFATAELVESPVYIKNILPVGSAVKDGRLQAGDRLLKINGTPVTGKTQTEVVKMLRSIMTGEFVDLVVSRQELSTYAGPQLLDVQPVASSGQKRAHKGKSPTRKKFLQFDVALNDTGSAGLGVSVKGRVSTKEGGAIPERRDLGIFVKSIMHGGAAFKDGRLKVDDQLVAINDTSLSDYSNLAAIDRLRSAMQAVSPGAKSIRLSVLRDCVPVSAECSKSSNGSTGNESSDASVDMGALSVPQSAKKQVTFDVNQRESSTSSHLNRKEESSSAQISEEFRSSCASSKNDSFGEERSQSWTDASDSFVRDAPGRQSMSEKRHCAAKVTPSSTPFYNRLKHERQTSAPAASHKGTAKGVCSPSSPRAPIDKEPIVGKRLSVSLENFGTPIAGARNLKAAPSAGAADQVVGLSPTKVRPTNDSFRAAVGKLSDGFHPDDDAAAHSAGTRQSTDLHAAHAVSGTTNVQYSAMELSEHQPPQLERNKARRKSAVGSLSSLKNFLRWGSTGKSKVTIQKSRTTSPHSFLGRTEVVEEENHGVRAHSEGPSLAEVSGRSQKLYKSQCAVPTRGISPTRPVSSIQLANINCAYASQKRFVPFSTKYHEEIYDAVDQRGISESSQFVRTYKMYSEQATMRTNASCCDSTISAAQSPGKPVLRPVIPPPDYDHYLRRKSLKSKGSRKPRPLSDFHDSGSQEAFLCRDEEILALSASSPPYANGYVTRL